MRIITKGGVWKNTEDEILKAAIMKYGLNQWARISSLLVRKTAPECKARWFEWLDPSIKKTEWSRDEDEKLLHLAKVLPNQWRTICRIVGRTAAQCMQRYDELLDAAAGDGSAAGTGKSASDLRRLRPGEVDPHPESRPARPDPIDMDDDEKEMLSEARARLANTTGKKAKRRLREKQLEEARRLAQLQKRRELRAAGVIGREAGLGLGRSRLLRNRKGIDYEKEIPFLKRPPPGIFPAEYRAQAPGVSGRSGQKSLQELDAAGTTPFRDWEEEQEKRENAERDAQRKRKAAEDAAGAGDESALPAELMRQLKRHKGRNTDAAALVDAQHQERFGARMLDLQLPAANLSESDLAEIARLSASTHSTTNEDGGVTAALLPQYGAATPALQSQQARQAHERNQSQAELLRQMRTPQTNRDEQMRQQVEELKAVREGRTISGKTEFDTPARLYTSASTSTPAIAAGGTTPGLRELQRQTLDSRAGMGGSTPASDILRLNATPGMGGNMFAEHEDQFDSLTRLSMLPAPKNAYALDLPEDADLGDSDIEEQDVASTMPLAVAEPPATEHELYVSSVVRNSLLPRPSSLPTRLARLGLLAADSNNKITAHNIRDAIDGELALIIAEDHLLSPLAAATEAAAPEWEQLLQVVERRTREESTVRAVADRVLHAKQLVRSELAQSAAARSLHSNFDPDLWASFLKTLTDQGADDLRGKHEELRSEMRFLAQTAGTIETRARAALVTQLDGMDDQETVQNLVQSISARQDELSRLRADRTCFESLAVRERSREGMDARIAEFRKLISAAEEKERHNQVRFGELQQQIQVSSNST